MRRNVYRLGSGIGVVMSVWLGTPGTARADEIWVAPTYQQDLGGVGVGSNELWNGR
jgi:hypothetical protein